MSGRPDRLDNRVEHNEADSADEVQSNEASESLQEEGDEGFKHDSVVSGTAVVRSLVHATLVSFDAVARGGTARRTTHTENHRKASEVQRIRR